MKTFAQVENGIVKNVLLSDTPLFDTWIEVTNATGIPQVSGSYDALNNLFIPIRPYLSWTFNYEEGKWKSPVEYPDPQIKHLWNETSKSWDPIP